MSQFPIVDPSAESTWKNHGKPADFPSFERELLAIGGKHPNGRPILRLQWAPHRFKFQLGRPRVYYVDTRIPTRRRTKRIYYQVKELADPFAPWITVEPGDLGRFPGEAFLHVVHHDTEVVTIARNQWVIEQYFPPDKLGDTPASWEARRFCMFTPPELGVPVYGDHIGPFPSDGEYRLVFVLEGPEEYSYVPPCGEALEMLRAAWHERENFHQCFTAEQRVANEYKAAEERDRKRLEELDERLNDELKPYDRDFEGNAFVSVPQTYKKQSGIILTDL